MGEPRFNLTFIEKNVVGALVEGYPAEGPITQVFGQMSVTGSRHGGMDIGASYGDAIRAPAAGSVNGIYMAKDGWGFGNWVCLNHGGNIYSAYAHMSQVNPDLRVGKNVEQGQWLGNIGSTGISTGPHLHWAISKGNPMFYLDFNTLMDVYNFVGDEEEEEDFMAILTVHQQQQMLIRLFAGNEYRDVNGVVESDEKLLARAIAIIEQGSNNQSVVDQAYSGVILALQANDRLDKMGVARLTDEQFAAISGSTSSPKIEDPGTVAADPGS